MPRSLPIQRQRWCHRQARQSKNCSAAFVGANGSLARTRVSFCKRDEKPMPRDGAHPIDKHVGTKLRLRRTKLGMSQSTLAEALGLTFHQVQKYEKGTNRIGAGRLQQIAHILQMPMESFFEGLPHEPGQRRVPTDAPDLQYCSRLSRHRRWTPARQGVHANPERKASAIHSQSCRATRRDRRSVKATSARGLGWERGVVAAPQPV
jgi:transcriptional regulator with XRE-family HTH domain